VRGGKRNGFGHFRYSKGDWLHCMYGEDQKQYGQLFKPDGTMTVMRWEVHKSGAYSVPVGEGVRFSADRLQAFRLHDGVEQGEAGEADGADGAEDEEAAGIPLDEACAILQRFGYVPLVPPIYMPPALEVKRNTFAHLKGAVAMLRTSHHVRSDPDLLSAKPYTAAHRVSDEGAAGSPADVPMPRLTLAELRRDDTLDEVSIAARAGGARLPPGEASDTGADDGMELFEHSVHITEPSDFAARLRLAINAQIRRKCSLQRPSPRPTPRELSITPSMVSVDGEGLTPPPLSPVLTM